MTTTRKITFDEGESESRRHNWHLDADGVEVAKGQGEGVPKQQETTAEHSPLPWKGGNNANGIPCIWTTTPSVNLIAKLYHIPHEMSDEANAAYIVKACNEYPKLLAALKQFTECNLTEENCASFEVANKRIRNLARTAIANTSKPADPFTDEKLHEMGCSYDREQIDGGE